MIFHLKEAISCTFLVVYSARASSVTVFEKQAASYSCSQNEFIQNQQRISVWGLQPWQTTCTPFHSKESTLLKKGRGNWRAVVKSPLEKLRVGGIVAFCCLTCDSLLSLHELLPGKKKFFFFLLGSDTA